MKRRDELRLKLLEALDGSIVQARVLSLETGRLIVRSQQLVDSCRKTRNATALTRSVWAIKKIQEKSKQPG